MPVTNLSSVGGGNVPAKAIDVPNSPFDLVLTTKPSTPQDTFTVNTNNTEIGVGTGQSLDDGGTGEEDNEVVRIDFVNVTVTGSGGNAEATFNEYYSANSFKQNISGLSGGQRADFTVKAIKVVDNPAPTPPADGDTVFYGDTNDTVVTGTTLNIYNASNVLLNAAQLTAAGVTVTDLGGGVWQVLNLPNDYDYEIVSATTSFQAVEVYALSEVISGQGGTDTFKLGFLTIGVLQAQGAIFNVPIKLSDADGDFVSSSIAVNLSAPVTPVVVDLDHDGVEFLSRTAGVMVAYFGDGQPLHTAWAGKDDGILAIDLDGNGRIDSGDEFVFGGNGKTDLEGLAAQYDSNHDGLLDAKDAQFAKFGVWQDANSNGVSDAGEFKSLAEMGITSIDLTSDGKTYVAANGDVVVHGETSFTWSDGSTGVVADASFAVSGLTGDGGAATDTGDVMGSLLSLAAVAPASSDEAGQSVSDDPASILQALDDSNATNFIDNLVNSLAGGGSGAQNDNDGDDSSDLATLLAMQVGPDTDYAHLPFDMSQLGVPAEALAAG